jgi:phage-related protein
MVKPARFLGDSLRQIRNFPDRVQKEAGVELHKVQQGIEPNDWKPMNSIGAGVMELRIHDDTGAFRLLYIAKFLDAVYVLHAFQKKSQKTAKPDLDLAAARLKQLIAVRT